MARKNRTNLITVLVVLLIVTMTLSTSAATLNSIDRIPPIKTGHIFMGDLAPVLYIEEAHINEFNGEPQRIRLTLINAEWTNQTQLQSDITDGGGADGFSNLTFLSDTIMQITLVPEAGPVEKGWWRIPLYSEVTGGPTASVSIDAMGASVTGGIYSYAEVVDSQAGEVMVSLILPNNRPLTINEGEGIELSEEAYIKFTETENNTIQSENVVFSVRVENAEWSSVRDIENALSQLKLELADDNTPVEISEVIRISNQELEITLEKITTSNEAGEILFPITLESAMSGKVDVSISLKDTPRSQVSFTVAEVMEIPEVEMQQKEVVFTVGEKGYRVNGIWYEADVAPYIKPTADGLGRLMVPVKFASRALEVDAVLWDQNTKQIQVVKGERMIRMTIGDNNLYINESMVKMDTAAEIMDLGDGLGRTMLPVSHLANALEVKYEWHPETQSVTFFLEN